MHAPEAKSATLRPMREAEFAAWRPESLDRYAAEQVASGAWSPADAPSRAEQSLASLLPEGLATAGHRLFVVQDARGESVGMAWIALRDRAGSSVAYVYELWIQPGHQRQGHAERAMRALEAEARALGCRGLALHVFGHNHPARSLYEKLGYAATDISMYKPLTEARS